MVRSDYNNFLTFKIFKFNLNYLDLEFIFGKKIPCENYERTLYNKN